MAKKFYYVLFIIHILIKGRQSQDFFITQKHIIRSKTIQAIEQGFYVIAKLPV